MIRARIKIVLIIVSILLVSSFYTASVFAADDVEDGGYTVYVTLSENSEFLKGKDSSKTVMARVPVKLKYFDLADYGLERFYRLDDDDEVIEQPTVLHLLIRILEKYYACRTLTSSDMQSDIIQVTGAAKSLWLNRLWGHDGNLMYFVNHEYPLMYERWGATADFILLEEGDEVELAMYTDYSFYNNSAFLYFENSNVSTYTGRDVKLKLLANPTAVVNDGVPRENKAMPGESVRVSSNKGKTWRYIDDKTDDEGIVRVSFDEPGTYYVATGPVYANYKDAAPAIGIITVREKTSEDLALEIKMEEAKNAIDSFVDTSLYREAEVKTISDLIKRCKEEIENANDEEAIDSILRDYKMRLASIKTDADYRKEEIAENFGEQDPADSNISPVDNNYHKADDQTGDKSNSESSNKNNNDSAVRDKAPNSEGNSISHLKVSLKRVKIKKVKAGKKRLTVTWKKVKNAAFYKIRVRLMKQGKKKGGKWKTYTVKGSKLKKVIKKLKKGRKYQVKVRACRKTSGKVFYGKWSKAKKVKIRR